MHSAAGTPKSQRINDVTLLNDVALPNGRRYSLWFPRLHLVPSGSLWFAEVPSGTLGSPLVPAGSLWFPLAPSSSLGPPLRPSALKRAECDKKQDIVNLKAELDECNYIQTTMQARCNITSLLANLKR